MSVLIHCKAVGEGMPLDPSLTLKRSFIMLPMRKCFVSLLSASFALAGYAAFETATYYVDAARGDDANDGSSPEKAKATIQAMYNAATADATIWVAPGAYSNDVGRGADSTHWWGRSRLHLGEKSMRIVSTGGAAVTHIVGKLGPTGGYGSTGNSDYGSATRCIDVEWLEGCEEIVVEGFTLRDGATLDVNAHPRGSGAAVFCWDGNQTYPKAFALVDCVISNCYGAYSLVTGGSLVRCRIEGNTFYRNSAGELPFSFTQCNVLNSRVFNNRAVDRETRMDADAGNVRTVNSRFVNTTFANNRHAHYSNAPTWYHSCLFAVSSFRTDDGSTEANGGCQSNVVVDTVSTRCALAPTAGDIRIRKGSVAETAGRVDALADESLFPLPSGVDRFRDIDGHAIASGAATICAGASQTLVTPPGGAICGDSEYVSFDGIDRPHRTSAWAYPEAWPASVQLRAASRSGQTFRRFGLSDCGYRDIVGASTNRVRSSRLPVRGDDGGWNTAWFIPPRATDAALTVSASYEAAANVRVCDPGADAAEADGSSEKPYRTVQAAIDSLGNTGLVLLRPGIYAEGNGIVNNLMKSRVAFGSKNVTVRGLDGAEQTVIQGEADPDTGTYGPNAMLVAALNSSAQIQGATLTGGYSGDSDKWEGADGRGAIYSYGQDLELVDCIITNNVGKNYALGTAWFERCLIRDNTGGVGLAIEPAFVSCVIGGNAVTTPSRPFLGVWNAYVTKIFSTTFVGDGARMIWASGGSLAACAVNSVIDRGKGPTAFAKGGVTGCVLNGFDPSGTGFVAADPMLRDADTLDVRLFALSPALSAAKIPADGELGESWWYACPMDFHGNPWRFDDAGRLIAGAVQETFAGGVYVAKGAGYEVVSGGTFGFNELKEGETLTIGFAPGSTRPLAGFVVNGVTNLFAESTAGVPTLTVHGGADGIVEPIYSSTWYVDAVNGNDTEKFGYNPAMAYRTLAAALANPRLVAGQTVMALPGTYREGTMIQNAAKSVRARGVVPAGVTLASRDGAAATVIEGAPATAMDSANTAAYQAVIDTGLGKDAIRGVYLQANATVEGFTFTNCFTRGANDAGVGLHSDDDGCGAGVRAADLSCVVRDCVFVGNKAFRGGGVYHATAVDCVFDGNTALYGGGAASDANLYGCLTKNNVCAGNGGWGGLFYYGTVDSCTVLDSLGGANSLRSRSTVNTLVLGRLGDWDWAVGPTNYAHCCFANDVGGFVQNNADYRSAIESGDGNILATLAELPVDDDGRPLVGNAAVDQADAALSAHVGDQDLLGGQRVYNGVRDIGALEADWRTAYARDVNRRLTVSSASPAVVETADRRVRLVDGTSLVAKLRGSDPVKRILVRATVSGGGALDLRVNGETVQTLTAGETEAVLALANSLTDELSFAYAGEGFADIGRLDLERGFFLIVR